MSTNTDYNYICESLVQETLHKNEFIPVKEILYDQKPFINGFNTHFKNIFTFHTFVCYEARTVFII